MASSDFHSSISSQRNAICVVCKCKPVWVDPYSHEPSPYCGNTCRQQEMRENRKNQMCKHCKVKRIVFDPRGNPSQWCSKSCRDKDLSYSPYSSSNQSWRNKWPISSILRSPINAPNPNQFLSDDPNAPPPYIPRCTEESCNDKCAWDDRGVLYTTCGEYGCLSKEKREEPKKFSMPSKFSNTGTSSSTKHICEGQNYTHKDYSQDCALSMSRNPGAHANGSTSNYHDNYNQSSIVRHTQSDVDGPQLHVAQGEGQGPFADNSRTSLNYGIQHLNPQSGFNPKYFPSRSVIYTPFTQNSLSDHQMALSKIATQL